MNDFDKICTILFRGFVDIRFSAYEKNTETAFLLSDLLHNIPLSLKREAQEGSDFSKTLNDIYKQAEARGITSWVQKAVIDDG